MLYTWQQDNKTTKWNEGLPMIQFMKNRAYHSGIKRSPYKAMLGVPARLGLENTDLPREILPHMTQEDEVSEALEEMQDTPCTPTEGDSTSSTVNASDSLSSRAAILHERENASQALVQQAKRMKRDSNAKFPEVDVGASVRVPVPDVNSGKTDARSVLARVMTKTYDGLYELATRNGKLAQLYARSQFTVCKETSVELEAVPDETISLRSAATKESKAIGGHGQGFVRCNCVSRCKSKDTCV